MTRLIQWLALATILLVSVLGFSSPARAGEWPVATKTAGMTTLFVIPTASLAAGGTTGLGLGYGVVAGGHWKANDTSGFAVGLRLDGAAGNDAFGGAAGGVIAATKSDTGALRSFASVSPRWLFGHDWRGRTYRGADLRLSVNFDEAWVWGVMPPTFLFGVGYYKTAVIGGGYFWEIGYGF